MTGWDFPLDLLKVLVGAIVASGLAWFVGNRIGYRWDEIRRRRESDLAARDQFCKVYGEFFAIWKLWDAHKRYGVGAAAHTQWILLERAEGAEGAFEGLLTKVASERSLCERDTRLLASFRQAYQSLREQIRSDRPLDWWARDIHGNTKGYRQYRAFKALGEYFATLLAQKDAHPWFGKPASRPDETEAVSALLACTLRARAMGRIAESELKLPRHEPHRKEGSGRIECQWSPRHRPAS